MPSLGSPSCRAATTFSLAATAARAKGEGEGEGDTCAFANDGACDEDVGLCEPGTDSTDCTPGAPCQDASTDCRTDEVCRFQQDDVAGTGAPDPLVTILVNDDAIARSEVALDTFTVDPVMETVVLLRSSDTLGILVVDDDDATFDVATSLCVGECGGIGSELLRGFNEPFTTTCEGGGLRSITIAMEPTPE